MGKFHTMISSLFVFGTANITFMPPINFTNQKGFIPDLMRVAKLSSDEDDFIYSGYLLRYFIYKSSNISQNNTIRMLEENIINNKTKIYGQWFDTSNVTLANKKLFEMSLMASIVNISIYGMKTWKEFFAEAYSKWTTTPDEMKNKSWEILNEFFIEIYAPLQKNNFGSRMDGLQSKLKIIDEYVAKSSISYDTNLTRISFDNVNLNYNSRLFNLAFGLQQPILYNPQFWQPSYTFNALKTALIMWQSNGKEELKNSVLSFNGGVLQRNIIDDWRSDLRMGLKNMMNDSYTKAKVSSIKKYEKFVNNAKEKYYSSFEQLDRSLKSLTKYENNYYHQMGSTIFLKDSIEAMQKYYHWNNDIIDSLKNQILELFNITYAITDDNFKYFLNGFLFSPDAPLQGHSGQTVGYTTYSFQKMPGSDKIMTTSDAYVIISTKGFDNILQGKIASDYYTGWWSSPNVFCTLNHEMGHAIDAYFGMIKDARSYGKKIFNEALNTTWIKGKYNGNIFGYDDITSYNQKVNIVKIILIIIFGTFCASIIIIVIFGTSRKLTPQKK